MLPAASLPAPPGNGGIPPAQEKASEETGPVFAPGDAGAPASPGLGIEPDAMTGIAAGAGPGESAPPPADPPRSSPAATHPAARTEPEVSPPEAGSSAAAPAGALNEAASEQHESRSLLRPAGARRSAAPEQVFPPTPVAATVRATGDDGRMRWRGNPAPVKTRESTDGLLPATGVPLTPPVPAQTEPVGPAVSWAALENPAEAPAAPAEPPAEIPEAISLRLEPILKQLPLELESPEIRALRGSNTRVELPTQLIRAQLAHGRVAVSAGAFAKGLPEAERAVFQRLDPEAQIPVPLQEIFTKLPVNILKPRSDQIVEPLGELILTPFTVQAREDAMRFERQRKSTPRPLPPAELPGPYRAGAPAQTAPGNAPAPPSGTGQPSGTVPPEATPNLANALTQAIGQAPEALQAIFLRDDIVDLASALQAVIHLPGVHGAVLNSTEGEPLAGYFGHLPSSAPAIRVITELLSTISQRFLDTQPASLESVSFHLADQQITGFFDGVMYLIVVHSARPFRPGVREKIHAFMRELIRLSAPAAH